MDLQTSAIRTLFYDADLNYLQEDINNHTNSFLKSDFAALASWTTRTFTKSELSCLQNYVLQQAHCGQNAKWHQMINLLPLFVNSCLKNQGGKPFVNFDYIQKWRELSLLTGEDILTNSFLAFDVVRNGGTKPTSFDWPNIIPHQNVVINSVLDKGLSDTHAHLKASADAFELTWLDFMNRLINRDEDYRKVKYIADAQIYYRRDQQNYDFRKMVQTAAILRLHLFECLKQKRLTKSNASILRLIADDASRTKYLIEAESRIRCYQTKLNKIFDTIHDYAIDTLSSCSVYAIHEGERLLLFDFFKRYFSKEQVALKIADLFFLYISLKIRVRKEFIQTNPLYGFDNFKIYESRKTKFCSDTYKNIFPLYAVQSSIREGIPDTLEARVSPVEIPKQDVRRCVDGINIRGDINEDNLTFVIHFIKKSERQVHKKLYGSRYDYNQLYRKEIDSILEEVKKRKSAKAIKNGSPIYKIVGMDAAGAEIDCSPAVFGQIYRYARLRGMINLTYHVGEDFYDLCDGLHAIDEAIRFLNLERGSRIGHAIALGINPKEYYERRCFQTIMTRQRLLDTLAWVYGTALENNISISVEYKKELLAKAQELYDSIGYNSPFDIDMYVKSMMLRSDSLDTTGMFSDWRKAAFCEDSLCKKARTDKPMMLCHEFLTDKNVWEKGNKIEIFKYKPEIIDIALDLQLHLNSLILDKQIVIETNPSSNVVIGPIDGYEEHSIHKFIKDGVNATLNTDDKGIFSTSLPNEYSLFASSAIHNGINKDDIKASVDKLRKEAKNSRFLPINIV